jgi:propionyl-CoA carboxylase beta chain
MGPCAGGAVYSPAITDFIFMVKETSHMFITGPDVIKTVTGEEVGFEELGGAITHNTKSGVAQFASEDEDACLEDCRYLLSFLPSNNLRARRAWRPPTTPSGWTPSSTTSSPTTRTSPTTCATSSRGSSTTASSSRCTSSTPRTSSAASRAWTVTRSASSATSRPQLAGVLDIDASEKAARFVRTCDAFNIPLLTFCDVPGFLPGTAQEWGGIIRHGAKLLYAFAEATVPKVTIITRKAYGGAYDVMSSKHLRRRLQLRLADAEVAVMGPEGAVNIIYRRDIAAAPRRLSARQKLMDDYKARFANPYTAAERGYIDDVIVPHETRPRLIVALRTLQGKREPGPKRKHGNIPL